MKAKRILLSAFVLVMFIPFVKAHSAELFLRLENNRHFELRLNHVQYNVSNRVHIQNLKPGQHYIEVYEMVGGRHGYQPHAKRLVRRYAGYIRLIPGYRLNTLIDRHNRLIEVSRSPIGYVYEGNPAPNYHEYQQYGMDNYTYKQLLSVLHNTSFDSNKLTIARQATVSNGCTAEQVLGIMRTFSFESNRLSFAKYAYQYCVNPGSYFIVNHGFSFESSKRELARFIGQ